MNKYGLCIGINDYPGTGSDLAGCVNDARDWSATLRQRGFRVRSLLDRAASRRGITSALANILGEARGGDLVVVTYSGHGTWVPDRDGDEPDARDEAWCPHDLRTNGVILDDELAQLFEQVHDDVRLIVISDSCHSGTVTRAAPAGDGERAIRFLPPTVVEACSDEEAGQVIRHFRPRARDLGGALLLAGCQDWEYSYDAYFSRRANGAFTRAALDALRQLPADATYDQWFRAIRGRLPSRAYPQTPNAVGTPHQLAWRIFV